MTAPQHHHADHLAAIAGHLDNTPEATAPGQSAGDLYISKEGDYIRRVFHRNHDGEVTINYFITAYEHTTDIAVDVKHSGIKTSIMVPGDTPAEVIAHAVMSALRSTKDIVTNAAHVERIQS